MNRMNFLKKIHEKFDLQFNCDNPNGKALVILTDDSQEPAQDKVKAFIDQSLLEFAEYIQERMPEKDTTPDADEYERADRMAWNVCLEQVHTKINEIKSELNTTESHKDRKAE